MMRHQLIEHTLRYLGHSIRNEKCRCEPGEVVPTHVQVGLKAHNVGILFLPLANFPQSHEKLERAYIEG